MDFRARTKRGLPASLIIWGLLLGACGRTQPVRYPPTTPDAGVVLPACIPGVVTPSPEVASILFVIDRSGSMAFDLMGNRGPPFGPPLQGPTRWNVLRDSLSQVLPSFDQRIAMGAAVFPSNDECGVSMQLDVEPQVGNVQTLLRLFARRPLGGTPTFDAVELAASQVTHTDAQTLVLITDGEPNCNAALDPFTCVCTSTGMGPCPDAESCLDDVRSVEAVRQAHDERQVLTYVIGIGTNRGSFSSTLDSLAIAGGAPRPGLQRFYSATSETELTEALRDISNRVTRCAWSARSRLEAKDHLEVHVGEQVVPADGWRWIQQDEGSFLLLDTWCDRAEAGAPVTVVLACE